MSETSKLRCPECDSDDVIVSSISSYYVNSGEFFCHSVKPHDADSPATCLECWWKGVRQDLIGGEK